MKRAIIKSLRCATSKNTHPDPSSDPGDSNYWNKVTVKDLSANDVNGIEIAETADYDLKNVTFIQYEDPTAGFVSGNSLYILDSDNWRTN